jgi:hypothetical protein
LIRKFFARYQLKTSCRTGITHVIFESLDFIAKLAALAWLAAYEAARKSDALSLRVHPKSKHRVRVTLA